MGLTGNTLTKSASIVNFVQLVPAIFALLAGVVACLSVFLNDVYFWLQSSHYINPYLLLFAILLGLPRHIWGLMGLIFLLPLSAGLGTQLNAYIGTEFLVLPNSGLDLAAGFFLGTLISLVPRVSRLFQEKTDRLSLEDLMGQLAPWPIALVIAMITISTAIAIARNVHQSAAATSIKGLLYNLIHFRPIGWHDDYMPISDWIAYALAVGIVITVIGHLKGQAHKNQIIFRSIMAGLIVATLMGVAQAITGLGLPENLLSFRKDQLGYAVIGFQPDLHAFAGHMLLGVVGLWGYFFSGISRLERKFILLVVALCWVGLILSKSRALLLIALMTMFIWLVWYLWKKKHHFFLPSIVSIIAAISILIALIFNFSNHLSGIPVLSWLGELANEFKNRDLTSWSLFSGIFGSRFEIWEAAIRMWWEFPLMGIGQGNFYRLSDIASFSKSHFLILNKGENAHNYFLQTLTETGIFGLTVFAITLLLPFKSTGNKKILFPALIAIISLFLGNIFSHSFLVRENLLLASIFLGLFYLGLDPKKFELNINKTFGGVARIFLGILVCFYAGLEVRQSFNKAPFQYGQYCFKESKIWPDGWTSGAFEITLPKDARGIELNFSNSILGDDKNRVVNISLDYIGLSNLQLSPSRISLSPKDSGQIQIFFLNGARSPDDGGKVRFELPYCFTPRNLGMSIDSRRVGVRLLENTKVLYE
jgi:O-antigen ligase